MEICVEQNGKLTLRDAHNLKAFKLLVEGSRSSFAQVQSCLGDAGYAVDPDVAFIHERWLRDTPALRLDAAWQDGLSNMITYARTKGWIDPATGAIQAHIEWAG